MPDNRSAQRTLFERADNTLIELPEAQLARLSPAWQQTLQTSGSLEALHGVSAFLANRIACGAEIYPRFIFRALEYVEVDAVRVVILGQDPYHGPGQAQGLAFSVPNTCPCPPSLRNIFKELALEYPDAPPRKEHYLGDWASQGVLLLNTALTVEASSPGSHAKKGWELITNAIIRRVAQTPQPKVFMLWGAHAQSKQALLADSKGGPLKVLSANHPSPLSALRPPVPFIGCGHFSLANEWLDRHHQAPVEWLRAGA
ncbi:uracil-DNA glycosylase [Candidimonas sp. SYP-B2681]|uniref:uracil-DNA glycosylase n=1 Tax=Candidimonas sp. SYP-B2681 TaxID=2497686 RepID=UPI000F85FE34|nr:uracil-DNA glycosylase [Candidimonas sp. SYP-B2681]RTZ45697.1 uracil-DNA glycosylase [Candidimonas sp. SYP-B2681]